MCLVNVVGIMLGNKLPYKCNIFNGFRNVMLVFRNIFDVYDKSITFKHIKKSQDNIMSLEVILFYYKTAKNIPRHYYYFLCVTKFMILIQKFSLPYLIKLDMCFSFLLFIRF